MQTFISKNFLIDRGILRIVSLVMVYLSMQIFSRGILSTVSLVMVYYICKFFSLLRLVNPSGLTQVEMSSLSHFHIKLTSSGPINYVSYKPTKDDD